MKWNEMKWNDLFVVVQYFLYACHISWITEYSFDVSEKIACILVTVRKRKDLVYKKWNKKYLSQLKAIREVEIEKNKIVSSDIYQ